jgi:hypothetical protein
VPFQINPQATKSKKPRPQTRRRFLVQNIIRSEQETGVAFDPLAADLDKADNVLDK